MSDPCITMVAITGAVPKKEGNIKYVRNRLASSNAKLVKKVVDVTDKFNRRPATPKEARQILGLRQVA